MEILLLSRRLRRALRPPKRPQRTHEPRRPPRVPRDRGRPPHAPAELADRQRRDRSNRAALAAACTLGVREALEEGVRRPPSPVRPTLLRDRKLPPPNSSKLRASTRA